jgi:hypothetical protein
MAEKPYARYGTLHPLRQALRQAQETHQDVLRMQRPITAGIITRSNCVLHAISQIEEPQGQVDIFGWLAGDLFGFSSPRDDGASSG